MSERRTRRTSRGIRVPEDDRSSERLKRVAKARCRESCVNASRRSSLLDMTRPAPLAPELRQRLAENLPPRRPAAPGAARTRPRPWPRVSAHRARRAAGGSRQAGCARPHRPARGRPRRPAGRRAAADALRAQSAGWPSWDSPRASCATWSCLLKGASRPARLMGRRDYESVRDRMRLADGTLWPMPVRWTCPRAGRAAAPARRWRCATPRASCWRRCTSARCGTSTASGGRGGVRHAGPTHPPSTTVEQATARTWRDAGGLQRRSTTIPRPAPHAAQLRALFASMGWGQVVAFPDAQPPAPGAPGADAPGGRTRGRTC